MMKEEIGRAKKRKKEFDQLLCELQNEEEELKQRNIQLKIDEDAFRKKKLDFHHKYSDLIW